MGKCKMSCNSADTGRSCGASKAVKVGLAILGVGLVTGTTLVIGMDRVMKKIFVNEEWPEEEWANDDWAEEDLEG